MKLKKFFVKGLFGIFDHTITVNDSIGITIVIGENGLGKTVMLEMIDYFFKSKFYYFNKVNFEEIIFTFGDNIQWKLEKKKEQNNNEEISFSLLLTQINKNKTEHKPIKLETYSEREMKVFSRKIKEKIFYSSTKIIKSGVWDDIGSNEIYRTVDGEYIPIQRSLFDYEFPKWFTERLSKIAVNLIETQRLLTIEEREDRSFKKTVEEYSKELTQIIKSNLTESTELSSKLDRTYPNRLIERMKKSSNVTDEFLNEEFLKLETKRELLDSVGLIEIEKDSTILTIGKPENLVRDVLMLYVEDSFKKIEIFDEIAKKIDTFLAIINKRFKHKKLHIDKENGFSFKSTVIKDKKGVPEIIPINKLSSGEQNELVLFYFLLFKTKSNSLILIDEPEVSLHISWQNSFIEDLKQIIALNKLEVVIATHSPDIIANNWDLKVELKGIE